jgi:hypothetical protein
MTDSEYEDHIRLCRLVIASWEKESTILAMMTTRESELKVTVARVTEAMEQFIMEVRRTTKE